ncbi:MAG TPA: nuclear transport factor 2 family protein [Solirubrobacteraceae bacterium]|nr:nuclear transport factor 2 family protein [Solirubrobacteraceae bacterium]
MSEGEEYVERIRAAVASATPEEYSAAMGALIHSDAVARGDGSGVLGGAHRGWDSMSGCFGELSGRSDDGLAMVPQEIVAAGPMVVVIQTATARRGERKLVAPIAVVWRFSGDKAVELWDHFGDVETWDRFWETDEPLAVRPPALEGGPTAADIVRLVNEVSERGDMQTNRFVADDVVFHAAGTDGWAVELHGKGEVLSLYGELHQRSGGTLRVEPVTVAATEDFAIVAVRMRAEREGRELDQVICGVWRLDDGVAVELWDHYADPAAWEAFWA